MSLKSSRMWCSIVGSVAPSTSKDRVACIFRFKKSSFTAWCWMLATWSFEKFTATHPVTKNHFLEDLNPQPHCSKNVKYFLLEDMLQNAKNRGITLSMQSKYCGKIVQKILMEDRNSSEFSAHENNCKIKITLIRPKWRKPWRNSPTSRPLTRVSVASWGIRAIRWAMSIASILSTAFSRCDLREGKLVKS